MISRILEGTQAPFAPPLVHALIFSKPQRKDCQGFAEQGCEILFVMLRLIGSSLTLTNVESHDLHVVRLNLTSYLCTQAWFLKFGMKIALQTHMKNRYLYSSYGININYHSKLMSLEKCSGLNDL